MPFARLGTDARSLALGVLALVLLTTILIGLGVIPTPLGEDRAEVRIVGPDGETRTLVDAEVADTHVDRYVGLSEHDSLEAGEGMLFVHADESERTYVMRDMDFDIDIVFVGADGEITGIEHARAPGPGEDGASLRHTGRAKWVLEVPHGYANETGTTVGDRIEIEFR